MVVLSCWIQIRTSASLGLVPLQLLDRIIVREELGNQTAYSFSPQRRSRSREAHSSDLDREAGRPPFALNLLFQLVQSLRISLTSVLS